MFNELKFAVRALKSSPGFSVACVLTLALGIGATTAIFSIVNAVVLRPLAFASPGELVAVRTVIPEIAREYPTLPLNARFYAEWKVLPVFSELALVDSGRTTLTGVGDPIRLSAAYTSANLLSALRVQPAQGRFLGADDMKPGQPGVAVISDHLWRTRFNGDPAIVGRPVTLNQRPVTIIGVLPAGFQIPSMNSIREPDVIMPRIFDEDELKEAVGRFNYEAVGRLAPGISRREAEAQLDVVAARLCQLSGEKVEVHSATIPLREAVIGSARRGLWLLLGAVAVVLSLACLNLGILGLTRSEARVRETAVRVALGASWSRLIAQSLAEALVLSVVGGVLGCVLSWWLRDALVALAPADLPRLNEVRIDGTVLLFTVLTTLCTTILAGIVPAIYNATRGSGSEILAGGGTRVTGGRASRRARAVFVGVEVAVSTVLLVLASLLVVSFSRVLQADVGVHAPLVTTTKISVPRARYRETADLVRYYQRVLAALANTPGVESAAVTNHLPLNGETWISEVHVPGDTRPPFQLPHTNVRFVSSGYFQTLGIAMQAGRTFRDDEPVDRVIISARLAATLWPGQDAVGRKLTTSGKEYSVVGVAADARTAVDQPAVAVLYQVLSAWPMNELSLAVRLNPRHPVDVTALRQAIRSIDAQVPIEPMRTMTDLFQAGVAPRRFQLRLVAAFAATALLLAVLGIYGVVAHSVTERRRELGIRLAFGALPAALARMILRQNLAPVLGGLAAGLVAAVAAGMLLASFLYEVGPRDPLTFAASAALLLLVALLACWLPARRATQVDPMVALRAD